MNFAYVLLTYFFTMFSYPMVRSATTTLLIEGYGAKSTPLAWLIAVVVLSITIWLCNKIQSKVSVQKLFLSITVFTSLLFLVSYFAVNGGLSVFSFVFYIWKEIYIVLLIHLVLAFCNTLFTLSEAKKLYGIVGALGSLGGIASGQLTSYLAKNQPLSLIVYISIAAILLAGISFLFTKSILVERKEKPPLKSIENIKGFVFSIAAIVALTQFCINIADLQFNLQFEKVISSRAERTSYLGEFYSVINIATLIIQFLLIPILYKVIKNKHIQFAFPFIYLALSFITLGSQSLFVVAASFISFKALDYSLFSVSKELLYSKLEKTQKYGAKYITDMFSYRAAKALIASVLIFVQNPTILQVLFAVFVTAWFILLLNLYKNYHNLLGEESHESLT